MSITLDRFQKLRAGDVLLFESGHIRTVQEGPADDPRWRHERNPHVTFSILRRSWTNRAYTGYCWTDIKDRIVRVVGRTPYLINGREQLQLLKHRFDIRKELVRTYREARETKVRMGRELCAIKLRPLP